VRAKIKAVSPVLPSQDVAVSTEFYVGRLGFKLVGQDSTTHPRYAVVVRDGAELHIQWHDPAEWSAVERPHIRFFVSSVEKLHDEYKDAGVFHAETALRDTPWGTREFAFYDPYSNGLTFYQDI
jgi:catechol 2,3-dioxygenase-like lactoylglutathione lyase family enzyme